MSKVQIINIFKIVYNTKMDMTSISSHQNLGPLVFGKKIVMAKDGLFNKKINPVITYILDKNKILDFSIKFFC